MPEKEPTATQGEREPSRRRVIPTGKPLDNRKKNREYQFGKVGHIRGN